MPIGTIPLTVGLNTAGSLRFSTELSIVRVPILVTAVVGLAMAALFVIFVVPNPFAEIAELSVLPSLAAGG